MKITGAIFDMDGTLLDSMDYWGAVAEDFLRLNGLVPPPDTNLSFLKNGMAHCHAIWRDTLGLTLSFEETKARINALMEQHYLNDVSVKTGAREMLDRLLARGVKMCLASATDRPLVESILKQLGLDKYFSRIFTCAEVGKGKRFPLIYELALEYLGTPRDETYVFEDAHYALVTAHENGFRAIGVYDKNVFATEDEIRALCDYYIDEKSNYCLPLD